MRFDTLYNPSKKRGECCQADRTVLFFWLQIKMALIQTLYLFELFH